MLTTDVPHSEVRINVPAILRGSWTWTSLSVQVHFRDPQPILEFPGGILEIDWGGAIMAVSSVGNHLYFQLDRDPVRFTLGGPKCIKLTLQ